MAMEIVNARPTENGLAVTFVTDGGVVPLEGTPDESAGWPRSCSRWQSWRR